MRIIVNKACNINFSFSVTIQKVDNSAHESWAYHRFVLVSEYSKKTFLPPPLNVLIYVFYPFYRFFQNRRPKKSSMENFQV